MRGWRRTEVTIRAIAHAIVRRYPKAWRERYEAEVRGLIDDTQVHVRDLGELLRGLATERVRELLTSDDSPRRAALILGLAAPITGVLFVWLAWLTALGVLQLTGRLSDPASYVALGLFCALGIAGLVLTFRGSKRRDPSRPLILPPDIALTMLPLTFVAVTLYALVVADAEPSSATIIPSWIIRGSNWMWFALAAGSQIASFFPGQDLLEAFARVSGAERQIRANETWVAGCRDMISKGVPSPLQDALAQVGKWTVERDCARARLKELGYRARFRGPIGHADDSGITA